MFHSSAFWAECRHRRDDRHAHRSRFGWNPREHHGGFGGGRGPRERMFDHGELQLVILHLLAETPSYGYQLIKTMETRLSGGYAPSPGVIYPTLTMLEEEGLTAASTAEGGKKVYTVTEQGKAHLQANKARLEEVLSRMEHAGRGFQRGQAPELMRAFMNLREAVMARTRRELTPEQLQRITEAIHTAAKTIDEL